MKKIFVIILFLFVSSASAQEKAETIKLPALLAGYGIEEIDLKDFFTDNDGCFVLLNPVTKDIKVYNPEQAAKRYIPASTFKIPNSIIALETGVANGPGFVIKWDSTNNPAKDYWPQSWRKDQTLKTAFQNSVVWYYREIARRIGEERMQEYINKFDYGNKNIGGGIDRFWLTGDLRISPFEEAEFVKRLYFNQLGFSDSTTDILKNIMILEKTPGFTLGGKTGTGNVNKEGELGWLVGYVTTGDKVYTYALNMIGDTVWEEWPSQKRTKLVHDILLYLNILPKQE